MRIGVIGSGLMGGELGTLLARVDHEVIFSYSRDEKKLTRLAKTAGENARTGTPAEAVAKADAVILAVHWSRVYDVLGQVGALSGRTVISCCLPMSDDDSHLVLGQTTSGAELLAARLPAAHIVSAFCTVPGEVLVPVFEKRKRASRPDLVHCGDNKAARRKTARLIGELGFNPVDLGGLSNARYIEPFALLMAQIAYNGSRGPKVAYRFERL
jgi:8-hydroxy-5-deazaflavin:NADPH oxidoreductase